MAVALPIAMVVAAAQSPAKALVLFTVKETGLGVEVTTSGSFTFSSAFFSDPLEFTDGSGINPAASYLVTRNISNPSTSWLVTLTRDPNAAFGNLNPVPPLAGDMTTQGSTFGFGYDSTDPTSSYIVIGDDPCPDNAPCTVNLTDSITLFSGATYNSLSLAPGTYTWSWGSGDDQKIQMNIEVPAPLPLLGGAAAFAWSRRLRRRVKASQASDSQLNGV
ncbi:MAG: hypothetical protein VKK97_04230 [Synechococcaceae cyanobacterium]|nr:hypothetical protein [Synechococcaceae cyanobacterium]